MIYSLKFCICAHSRSQSSGTTYFSAEISIEGKFRRMYRQIRIYIGTKTHAEVRGSPSALMLVYKD